MLMIAYLFVYSSVVSESGCFSSIVGEFFTPTDAGPPS